ncbi:MAG TPA: DNA polymerase IV [Gammaproteobacteria bacterium]
MENWPRVVLHADMDAFYASVEQRDNPKLRGKAVIVGGIGPRGVVSAASYEARRFGVHSAMPSAMARKRCPDGVFLPVRMPRYREVSAAVFDAMRAITPLVEGLSLDEAFLDITGSVRMFGGIRKTGEILRENIRAATGLNVSIGIAPSKFVAKIASDLEKPAGFVVVPPDGVTRFLDPLPLKRLWGLGPKTLPRVEEAGLRTFGELRRAPPEKLRAVFGNQAERFARLAAGIDDRDVTPEREDKSVSAEETFATDLRELAKLDSVLLALADKVAARLRRHHLLPRTVTVKIREADFRTHTRSHSFRPPSHDTRVLFHEARRLLHGWWREHPGAAIRLLGLGTSQFAATEQPDLFAVPEPSAGSPPRQKVDSLVDAVRERFGSTALVRGRLLDESGE